MTNTSDTRTPQNSDDPRSDVLSRAYRGAVEKAGPEPSRSIDEAIRGAARQALRSQRVEAAGTRSGFRRWRTPLALAATLLLAVGVTVRIYKTGEMDMAPLHETKARSTEETAVAGQKVGKSHENADKEHRAKGVAPKAVPPVDSTHNVARDREIKSPVPEAPDKQPALQETQPIPQPFPGAPSSAGTPRQPSEPASAPGAKLSAQTPESPSVSVSRRRQRDATAKKMEQEPAPATEHRTERQAEAQEFLPPPATAEPSLAKRLEGRPPEAWIDEIRALKRAGRSAEATDLLAEFRKKFSNFTLPDDLR
ncbi:MAG: hypothetical protein HY695_26715 [Deltaproteobacteria bacterium]|nr:hypothetical protein [Deltaproteobacteria bacterium]